MVASKSFTGTVVVVASAAGVGRAVAMRFAQEDAKLGISSRDRVALESPADEVRAAGAEVYAAQCQSQMIQSLPSRSR